MSKELTKEELKKCIKNERNVFLNSFFDLLNQRKELEQKVQHLQEQLKEAQNLIIYTANGHDHLFAEIKCEDYMHKYRLPKWGVK